MKTLTTIQEWIKMDPSKEEMEKVMKVINKMMVSKSRREIYENERNLRRLAAIEKKLKEVKMVVPGEIRDSIKELKMKVEELQKGLPLTVQKVKKEKK